LETTGWELVATLPAEEAFSPLTGVRGKVLIAAGIALLGASLLTWLVVRHLLIPLERLHQVVRKSETDLSAHAGLHPSRSDEIGDLATTFSAVMRTLSERTTALMEAREQAEERERRMQAIADKLPDFISYIDVNERYVFVNHAYEQRFKLPATEIIGRTVKEVWGEDTYGTNFKRHLDTALSGKSVTFDSELYDKGQYQCFEVTSQPVWNSRGDTVVGIHVFSREVTRERQELKQLEKKMLTDHLTGLLNRIGFEQRLASAMAQTDANSHMMALLLVDLDDFKKVNDTYGHASGDELLKMFAMRLKSCTRESDAVARIGGDEFALVLEGISTFDAVERAAQAIVREAAEDYLIDGHKIRCSASVGAALYTPAEHNTKNELFLKADTALYAAKNAGKSQFISFGTSNTTSHD
jgi:diguanylate cyclase (GGDEF)-like protein/PAS domain S-box-containing protein